MGLEALNKDWPDTQTQEACKKKGTFISITEIELNTNTQREPAGRFRGRFGNYGTLIFLHLPKTAGTTLRGIIERQYRRSLICRAYPSVERTLKSEQIGALPAETIGKIGLIEGHIEFGWHTVLPQKTVYLTMLREPIDRVISLYNYIKRDVNHPLYNVVRGGAMGIEDFLKRRINIDAINGQTYWLSGGLDTDVQSVGADALQKAKDNLMEFFPAVGIQERFDESLVLFKRVFNWRWVYYSSKNVAASRPSRRTMPDRIIRSIQDLNQLDMDLYRFALKRFEGLVISESNEFESEVAHFQVANRTYGRLFSPLFESSPRDFARDAYSEARLLIKVLKS